MTLIQTLNGGVGYRPRVFAVAFSKDGQILAVGGQGGILLFRVADGTLIQALNGAASTLSLAFSPDNKFLAAGSDTIDQQGQCTDCTLKTWRISDGALLQTIDGNNNGVISIAFSPNQRIIATGAGDRIYDGVVRFFRVNDGALLRFFYQASAYVTTIRYSPSGSVFAFGRSDGHVVVARNPFPSKK
jgi:WD40 repeat protein